ncbi:hypothetical protein BFP70_12465 [Thioclava sp. SK-1]|nr:hypothetical protein BFP70_12465 [Thioclava sp. SK-1]
MHMLPSRLRTLGPIAIGLVLFLFGLWALHHLLLTIDLAHVIARARATPPMVLIGALAATAVGYIAMIGYDWWALQYLGKSLPPRTVALGGFLGYAFGNTVGISVLSGGAIRYRIYSAAGLNAFDVAALSSYVAIAMGIGLTLVGICALAIHPAVLAQILPVSVSTVQLLAIATAVIVFTGALWLSVTEKTLHLGRHDIAMPAPRVLFGQLGVAALDCAMAAGTLWLLMPIGTPPFISFVAIYAAAAMIGILSHVPGGVGVFETVVITALPASVPVGDAAAALLLFRVIYFLVPFALAFTIVLVNEARLAGGWATRLFGEVSTPMRPIATALSVVVPRLSGAAVLGLGFWFLLVAMMPPLQHISDEVDLVGAVLAEGGTLILALSGVLLIVLSHALMRRVRLAYLLTLAAIAAATVAVLIDGMNIEPAVLSVLALLALLPFRSSFHRRARLTEGVFSPLWIALVIGLLAAAGAFFFLAHKAVPYSNALWLDFTSASATPAALRAGLLVSALLLGFLLYLALRPARAALPAAAQVSDEDVLQILRAQPDPQGWLALTGDKNRVMNTDGSAFVMFATRRNYRIVLGDPLGATDPARALAWEFHEAARRDGATPVFYEVSERHLPLWIDMGYTLHKLGEEAVVNLQEFSLSGSKFKTMRAEYNRAQRDGRQLELCTPPHSDSLLDALEEISDAWLAGQKGAEKGFSVGRFSREYLNQCELALIRCDGRILCFANLLGDPGAVRMGIDLMRYRPSDSDGVMQFLFLSLIEALKERGTSQLSLGLAPLSGLSDHPSARLTSRFGNLIFRHGRAFYNFEGLRRFKQKFRPNWQARYIAIPPGASPYLALAEIALLISGGARNLLSKD